MALRFRTRTALHLVALLPLTFAQEEEIVVTFRNEFESDVALFWESGQSRVEIARVPALGEVRQKSFVGHRFSWNVDERHEVVQVRSNFILVAPQEINVSCGELVFSVHPQWSPRGASRFLELVRAGYYDGAAVHRVVPKFLAQFGIGRDASAAAKWRGLPIRDDPSQGIAFAPGFVSFAGSGPDSRTTEIFAVMPDTPDYQLAAFGRNPWETPFATLDPARLASYDNHYGDMPPWGKGPDPQRIYRVDGYSNYLAKHFPNIQYLGTCQVGPTAKSRRLFREEDDEFAAAAEPVAARESPSTNTGRVYKDATPRTALAAYGPLVLIVLLACSMDAMRRRAKRNLRECRKGN